MPEPVPQAVPNLAKQRLETGGLVLCAGVRLGRTAEVARLIRAAGFDALFVDMEHSTITTDVAAQICTAALDAGVTPLVRVPGHEHHHAARLLDGGAMGVIVPHVDDAAEAQRAVDNAKFPPVGHRSTGGPLPQLGYAAIPSAEAMPLINANTLVTVMIETPIAVENADAIAAVDGVDQIMVGAGDLTATMGIGGQTDHPDAVAAYAAVAEACRRHGTHFAIGGVRGRMELLQQIVDMGCRFILGGADMMILLAAMRADVAALRELRVK